MLKITALTLATIATVGLSAAAQTPAPAATRPAQAPALSRPHRLLNRRVRPRRSGSRSTSCWS